jgi:hypothetical protein
MHASTEAVGALGGGPLLLLSDLQHCTCLYLLRILDTIAHSLYILEMFMHDA